MFIGEFMGFLSLVSISLRRDMLTLGIGILNQTTSFSIAGGTLSSQTLGYPQASIRNTKTLITNNF